jgi:RND family efflux transporter MFP subunit
MASTSEARLRWTSRGVRVGAGLILLAAAIGLFIALRQTRPVPGRVGGAAAAPIAPVIELRSVEAPLSYTGYGLARAMSEASVAAEVAARVVERPPTVEPGLPVRRGDLLIALDDTAFAHRVNAAERLVAATGAELAGLEVEEEAAAMQMDLAQAEVAIQQRDLDRVHEAMARGAGSEAEVDLRLASLRRAERELSALRERLHLVPSRRASLESRLEGLRADLAGAREELSRTRIVSPIDGILQEVAVRPGDLVAPGSPVARIVDLGRLEIPLRLPASAAVAVAAGDGARLWLDGPGERSWGGEVGRVGPDVEAQSRSLVVYVEVRQDLTGDARGLLRPGQFLVGRVATGEARAGLLVPRRAVQDDAVWVVERLGDGLGQLSRRQVVVGRYLEGDFPDLDPDERQWAVLESGAAEGELVAVGMAGDLEDGQTVRLADPVEGAGRQAPEARPAGVSSSGAPSAPGGGGQ